MNYKNGIISSDKDIGTVFFEEKALVPCCISDTNHCEYSDEKAEIAVRYTKEFAKKAFFLSSALNWQIVRDSAGALCLVPTKKHVRA